MPNPPNTTAPPTCLEIIQKMILYSAILWAIIIVGICFAASQLVSDTEDLGVNVSTEGITPTFRVYPSSTARRISPTPRPSRTPLPSTSRTPRAAENSTIYRYIAGSSTAINLREEPNTTSSRLASIPFGTRVETTGQREVDGEVWYEVEYQDKTGWVLGSLTMENPPVADVDRPDASPTVAQVVVPTSESVVAVPTSLPPTTAPVSNESNGGGDYQGPAAGLPDQGACPRNCDEARSMGVSAQRAAQCGLDRDHDGVACYGD